MARKKRGKPKTLKDNLGYTLNSASPLKKYTFVSFAILLLGSLALGPDILGAVAGIKGTIEDTQSLDLIASESQNIEITLDEMPDEAYLTSLKLSGKINSGRAKVYIVHDDKKYVLFNSQKLPEPLSITGFAVSDEGSGGEPESSDSSEDSSDGSDSSESDSEIAESDSETSDSEPDSSDTVEESSDPEGTTEETGESTESEQAVEEPTAEETPEESIEQTEEPVEEDTQLDSEEATETEEVAAQEGAEETPEDTDSEEQTDSETAEESAEPEEEIEAEVAMVNEEGEISFTEQCHKTCSLPEEIFTSNSYTLIIELKKGTTLELESITYDYVPTANQVELDVEIYDSNNDVVRSEITFEESETGRLVQKIEENPVKKVTKKVLPDKIEQGTYDVEIVPKKYPVESIEIEELKVDEGTEINLGLDDVKEKKDFAEWDEVFAIDPSKMAFEKATVTRIAEGTDLYKCKEWDFEEQECFGEWILLRDDLIPGEEYTVQLTPDDPAFAELTRKGSQYGKDTFIKESSTKNWGSNSNLKVENDKFRSFVRLDYPDIPATADFVSAELELYAAIANGNQVEVHRVTRSWDEGTGSGLSTGDGAEWSTYDGTNSWSTAGGDYDSAVEASTTVSSEGWNSWNITTLVRGWINGTYENHGVVLITPSETGLTKFKSSDANNKDNHPQIKLSYERPASGYLLTAEIRKKKNRKTVENITANITDESTSSNLGSGKLLYVKFPQELTNEHKLLLLAKAKTKSRELRVALPGSGAIEYGGTDYDDAWKSHYEEGDDGDKYNKYYGVITSLSPKRNQLKWYSLSLSSLKLPTDELEIYYDGSIDYYYVGFDTDTDIDPVKLTGLETGLTAKLFADETIDVTSATQTEPKEVLLEDTSGRNIGTFRVNFNNADDDIDFSEVDAETDFEDKKAFIHSDDWSEHIGLEKTLYVPSSGSGGIHICPDAATLEETTLGCANGFDIRVGETVNSVTLTEETIDGVKYYVATGITGTGGVELPFGTAVTSGVIKSTGTRGAPTIANNGNEEEGPESFETVEEEITTKVTEEPEGTTFGPIEVGRELDSGEVTGAAVFLSRARLPALIVVALALLVLLAVVLVKTLEGPQKPKRKKQSRPKNKKNQKKPKTKYY